MRRDVGIDAVGGKANARAGMFENVAELGAMQLGVGRHRGKAGVPDAVEQFEIGRRILGGDGDAVAGFKSAALAQGAGQPRGAFRQLAVGRDHARAGRRGSGHAGMTESGAFKPRRDVHGGVAVTFTSR